MSDKARNSILFSLVGVPAKFGEPDYRYMPMSQPMMAPGRVPRDFKAGPPRDIDHPDIMYNRWLMQWQNNPRPSRGGAGW